MMMDSFLLEKVLLFSIQKEGFLSLTIQGLYFLAKTEGELTFKI